MVLYLITFLIFFSEKKYAFETVEMKLKGRICFTEYANIFLWYRIEEQWGQVTGVMERSLKKLIYKK